MKSWKRNASHSGASFACRGQTTKLIWSPASCATARSSAMPRLDQRYAAMSVADRPRPGKSEKRTHPAGTVIWHQSAHGKGYGPHLAQHHTSRGEAIPTRTLKSNQGKSGDQRFSSWISSLPPPRTSASPQLGRRPNEPRLRSRYEDAKGFESENRPIAAACLGLNGSDGRRRSAHIWHISPSRIARSCGKISQRAVQRQPPYRVQNATPAAANERPICLATLRHIAHLLYKL